MADGATGVPSPYGPSGRTLGTDTNGPEHRPRPYRPRPGTVPHRTRQVPYASAEDGAAEYLRALAAPEAAGAGRSGEHGASRATEIDSRRFRSILGRFATGVVAITATDPETGEPTGMAANSFTSVSLEPPLVSFCVAHTSTTWPRIRTADLHCVNILSAPQRDICLQLAAKGGDKFAGLGWTESPGGGPVLDGALAWLECEIEAEHVAGDHLIVVSWVRRLDRHHDGDPLIFFRGLYGSFEH